MRSGFFSRAGRWCAFPEHENPITPGPPHAGYVLVTAADERGLGAMVAYTTTRPWIGETPRGIRIFTLEQARATGQDRAFVLDLRRIAYIPVDSDWFPYLASAGMESSASRRSRYALSSRGRRRNFSPLTPTPWSASARFGGDGDSGKGDRPYRNADETDFVRPVFGRRHGPSRYTDRALL